MICFVVTWPQRTLRALRKMSGMPKYAVWSYDRLLRAHRLPAATWVFTDFDRLAPWDLELAAHVYRVLKQAGQRVLNDPGRARGRFDLLKLLHRGDINRFQVWRPYEFGAIQSWPVFLRTDAAHRGPSTDLLYSPEELSAALQKALDQGVPERDLMAVEYCAQPLASGVFRKYSVYRIGDRLVPALAAHEPNWVAKFGQQGCASEADYVDELERVLRPIDNPVFLQAFETANLRYGRMDYALVDGQVQVYEINSNPTMGRVRQHPYASRLKTWWHIEASIVAAFQAIDSGPGPAVQVDDPLLVDQKWRNLLPGRSWFSRRSRWVI